ncbi:MAG: diacylglycerol kinase family protein [Microbacterium sp.]
MPSDASDAEARSARGPEERRAALVYNPIKVDAETLRASVSRHSRQARWGKPLFFETTVEDIGDGAARAALQAGVDAVLVAGGDGTVRAVSEAMSSSGVPLTIVPSGTGNLLARNLQLPLGSPDAMVAAAFDGDERAIDVGFAEFVRPDRSREERAFVVMGGMGLDAAMIANTSGDLKKRVGWVAYVDGAARSLVGAKPFPVLYQVSGGHRMHRATVQSIVYANCGSLPAGLELIPEASIADGELDIAIFQPKNPLGWLAVWRRVAWDNSVLRRFRAGRRFLRLRTKDSTVRYARGTGIQIAASDARPVQLDGDEFGEATAVNVRVAPAALIVTVPRGAAPTASL